MFLTQLFRFLTSGVVNTIIGLAVIIALMSLGLHYLGANIAGYTVGLIFSFLLNRSWTFGKIGGAGGDAIRFAIIFIVAYLANLGVVIFFVEIVGVTAFGAQFLGIGVYTVINFLGMKYFAFKQGPLA